MKFSHLFIKQRSLTAVEQISLSLAILLAAAALFLGWRLFWFLTDDAFIAFRYISNSMRGLGYTWNAPPFRPVEGYTSFLWIVLLEAIWRLSGQAPPITANIVSLIFAAATMGLGIMMIGRLALHSALDKVRLPILFLVLIGVLSNRTFLTWSSSGLETAMFNFWLIAWLFWALFSPLHRPQWLLALSITAVAATLTRPDGLLLIATTLLLALLTILPLRHQQKAYQRHLWALAPMALIVAHFIWRKSKYGEWLPNTFAAKYVGVWLESGWRYFFSFVMEYSLWLWFGLLLLFLIRQRHAWRQLWPRLLPPSFGGVATAVCLTLIAHFAYYTFVIGGDHFEYRVYSHLIWPIWITAVWLLNQLRATAKQAIFYLSAFALAALPLQWVHWQASQAYQTRAQTFGLYVPIANYFPPFISGYVQLFDQAQSWLIDHAVAVRHQEHKIFYEHQTQVFPPRELGEALAAQAYPVIALGSVGVPAWTLPTLNIIDVWGLNDYVIARNPIDTDARIMAHSRRPPPGYIACFKPNVNVLSGRRLAFAERQLTPEMITACERQTWLPGPGGGFPSDLGLNHLEAPVFDHYLQYVWPMEPQILYYVRPEANNYGFNQGLMADFRAYAGPGCVVMRPPPTAQSPTELFAFFDMATAGALPGSFSWADFLQETADTPYHVAYMGLISPEVEAQAEYPLDITWPSGLRLLGYDLLQSSYAPGEAVNLTLYYQVERPFPSDHSFFIHLRGDAYNALTGGPLWSQFDGNPCGEQYPLDWLEAGSLFVAKALLPIPLDAPDGNYWLTTGLYNWQNGQRLPPANGEHLDDSLKLQQVVIKAP